MKSRRTHHLRLVAMQTFGTLDLEPALDHPDLLGAPVRRRSRPGSTPTEVLVAAIDPELADTAAMTEAYERLRSRRAPTVSW